MKDCLCMQAGLSICTLDTRDIFHFFLFLYFFYIVVIFSGLAAFCQ